MAMAKRNCNLTAAKTTREILRQIQAVTRTEEGNELTQDDIIVAALKLYLNKNKDIKLKIEEMNKEAE